MTTPDTGDDAGDDPGDDAVDQAGDESGDQAGDESGDQAGDETGDRAGDDAGAGDRRVEPTPSDREDPEGTGAGSYDGSDAEPPAETGIESGVDAAAETEQAVDADPAGVAATGDEGEELSHVAAAANRSDLTGPERQLDPRIRYVWIAQSVILAGILGAVGGAIGIGIDFGPLVGGAVFAVVAALGVAHSVLRFQSWRYQVREDSLYLERGVLTRVKTVVPYVRIQHVDASRGPLERLIGLASSVVYTAGSRGADVTIPGLTPERSEELQSRLEQLAIAAEGDDAV